MEAPKATLHSGLFAAVRERTGHLQACGHALRFSQVSPASVRPPRLRTRRELDTPQHFRKLRSPQHGKLLVRRRRRARTLQHVTHGNQPVRIGTDIVVDADRRRNRPDSHRAVAFDAAHQVTQARHRIAARRAAGDRIRLTEVQPALPRIRELPLHRARVVDPLLQARRRLRGRYCRCTHSSR